MTPHLPEPPVALVSNAITESPDEGTKRLATALAGWFEERGLPVWRLPEAGRSLEAKTLIAPARLRAIRRDARAVVYVPSQSVTAATFARSAVIRRSTGRPVVLVACQPRAAGRAAAMAARAGRPGVVLSPSPSVLRAMREQGLPARFLPMGVDRALLDAEPMAPRDRAAIRRRHGLPDDGPVVLHVGHVSRFRNLEWLLAVKRRLHVTATLVAGTSLGLDRDLLERLRGEGVVTITSFLPDVGELYRAADCYLFPVLDEAGAIGVPLSVLEAMASNLPVVTTPFGSLRQMFPTDGGGLRFVTDERAAVAAVEEALAADPAAVRTRDLVAPFTWDRVAELVMEEATRLCR